MTPKSALGEKGLVRFNENEDATHFLTTCPVFHPCRCKLCNKCTYMNLHFHSITALEKTIFIMSLNLFVT